MGFLDLFRGGPLPRLPWVPAKPGRTALPPVRLPRDERPHDKSVEWWHYMGYVDPQNGVKDDGSPSYDGAARTSFVLTILKGQIQGLSCLVGVVIMIDHAKKTHSVSKHIAPLDAAYFEPEDGKAICFHFGPRTPARRGPPEAFSVRGGMGKYTLDIDTDKQLALELSQDGPAVFLDQDGVFHYRALATHERNALDRLEKLLEEGIGILQEIQLEYEQTGAIQKNAEREARVKERLDKAYTIVELYPRILAQNPDLFLTGATVLTSASELLGPYNKELAKSALTLRLKLNPAVYMSREAAGTWNEEMAYYLWPGLIATGTLGVGVEEKRAKGRAWMEHQWGDLPIGDYRWRYLAVIVDEKYDEQCPPKASKLAGQWVFFEFGPRHGMKPVRHAYHVDPKGRVRTVHGLIRFDDGKPTKDGFPLIEAVEVIELRFDERIEETGASPACEDMESKAIHAKFHVHPIRNDQVCRTNLPGSVMPVFWEGACEIAIEDLSPVERRESPVTAWAIMELAGYP